MANNDENEEQMNSNLGQYLKNSILTKKVRKYSIILIIIIAVIVMLAGASFHLKLLDGTENSKDKKNGPAAARNIMMDVVVDEKGNINLTKPIVQWWQELKKNDNKLTHYLDSAEDLARLLNAVLITQYPDTRKDLDKMKESETQINWNKIIENMGKGIIGVTNEYEKDEKNSNNTNTTSSSTTPGTTTSTNTISGTTNTGVRGNTQASDLNPIGDRADNGDAAARQELITKLVQIINSVNGPYNMRPSVIIGQIFQETSYIRTPKSQKQGRNTGKTLAGTANNILSVNYNMFGPNDYKVSKDGQNVSIPLPRWAEKKEYDEFYVSQGATDETRTYSYETMRVYDCVEDCIEDYIALMVAYRPGLSNNDQSAYDDLLKGYAEDQAYTDRVNWFINEYNLTQYDNGGSGAFSTGQKQLSKTPGKGDSIQGIVKFKRKTEDNEELRLSYVEPSKFQELISNYQKTGTDEAKKEALSHFTFEYANGGGTAFSGNANFEKYALSDSQIRDIAKLCAQEQGSGNVSGVAAEASIMANLFELPHQKNGTYNGATGAEGLYNYIRYGGWFLNSNSIMSSESGSSDNPVTQTDIDTVRKVLVEGMRTLPKYVDEHDGFNNVGSVTTNGQTSYDVTNRSIYVKHESVIQQTGISGGNGHWTFCLFPSGDSGDPFGYTDSSKELVQEYGDACYDPTTWQVYGTSGTGTSTSGGTAIGNVKSASQITPQQIVQAAKKIMDDARASLGTDIVTIYGNSGTLPPCEPEKFKGKNDDAPPCGDTVRYISCDRLCARALWDLGFTDQGTGGFVCGNAEDYLSSHGFVKSTSFSDIGYGSIILVKHSGVDYWSHMFIAAGPIDPNKPFYRLDAGTDDRIAKQNPFNDEAWGYRTDDIAVYNIPGYGKGTTGNISSLTGGTTGSGTGTLSSQKGTEIVNYANQFVGNPYVWGGDSMTNGIDCSHFVWHVLMDCGVYNGDYLTSREWINVGTPVGTGESLEEDLKQAVAGDIIVWDGHVGIYDGMGKMVEAKGASYGITNTYSPRSGHPYLGIRRFTDDVSTVNTQSSEGGGTPKLVVKIAKCNETTTTIQTNDPDGNSGTTTAKTMSTELIDYQKVMSKYQMPFNYLWALLIISQDKEFVFDVAKLVYESEFVITIFDSTTQSNSTTTENYEKVITTEIKQNITNPGGTQSQIVTTDTSNVYKKTTNIISKEGKTEIALTRAKSWCSDYNQEYEYSQSEKEVIQSGEQKLENTVPYSLDANSKKLEKIGKKAQKEIENRFKGIEKSGASMTTSIQGYKASERNRTSENTTEIIKTTYTSVPTKARARPEPNLATLLKNHYNAKTNILSSLSWLEAILEKNDDTKNMVEVTLYYINQGTGAKTGVDKFDFSEYDPERFIPLLDELAGESNEEKIWFALKNEGFSDYAIAGAMGNLDEESGLKPNNLKNAYETKLGSDNQYTAQINNGVYTENQFATDEAGYGICQWTTEGRKRGLYKYVYENYTLANNDTSETGKINIMIDDLKAQLEYLVAEIKGTGPAASYAELINKGRIASEKIVSTEEDWENAQNINDATLYFMRFYESPSDLTSFESRKTKAQKYYDLFHGKQAPSSGLISNSNSNSTAFTGDFLAAAKKVHDEEMDWHYYTSLDELNFSDIEGALNNPSKATCCSTYVSCVIYASGYASREVMNSSDFNAPEGIYEFFKAKGWQEITSYSELQPGDVVFMYGGSSQGGGRRAYGHVQIYAGDGTWFNAGSNSAIQSPAPYSSDASDRFCSALRPTPIN